MVPMVLFYDCEGVPCVFQSLGDVSTLLRCIEQDTMLEPFKVGTFELGHYVGQKSKVHV